MPPLAMALTFLMFPSKCLQYLASKAYDLKTDCWTIEGVRITGAVFRNWAQGPWPTNWFRITKNSDGILTVERREDEPPAVPPVAPPNAGSLPPRKCHL